MAMTDSNNPSTRRCYQQQVEALLAELAERRQRINVLQTWGVQPIGLLHLTEKLQAVRVELAATTSANSTLNPRPHDYHPPDSRARRLMRELLSTKHRPGRSAQTPAPVVS